jgi:outer membrane protein assembly factor BamB
VIVGRRFYVVTHDLRVSLSPPGSTITDVRLVGWDLDEPCADTCEPDLSVALPLATPGRVSAAPDGTTVFVSTGRQLLAADLATGSVRWSSDDAGGYPAEANAPTVTHGQVFLPAANTLEAYAVEGCGAAVCAPTWSTTLPGAPVGQAAAAGGLLFVGTADGTVAAYPTSCSDGCAPAWSVSLGSAVTAAPIVTDGRVIVGTADGRLVAFGLPAE